MQDYLQDTIKGEILKGLKQVDSSFFISTFSASLDKKTRKLKVEFTAETDNGEEISEVIDFAE